MQQSVVLDVCLTLGMQAATGLEWSDMLFFDDEHINVDKACQGG
jgi:hypothetical protein